MLDEVTKVDVYVLQLTMPWTGSRGSNLLPSVHGRLRLSSPKPCLILLSAPNNSAAPTSLLPGYIAGALSSPAKEQRPTKVRFGLEKQKVCHSKAHRFSSPLLFPFPFSFVFSGKDDQLM